MVGERRRYKVPPRGWTGDVDEDEVRAVATLAVEAYDIGRSAPDDWPGRNSGGSGNTSSPSGPLCLATTAQRSTTSAPSG